MYFPVYQRSLHRAGKVLEVHLHCNDAFLGMPKAPNPLFSLSYHNRYLPADRYRITHSRYPASPASSRLARVTILPGSTNLGHLWVAFPFLFKTKQNQDHVTTNNNRLVAEEKKDQAENK